WQQLLQDEKSQSAADGQLDAWGAEVENGGLPSELLVDLMSEVYEPRIHRSGLQRFFARDSDFQDSFWGEVYRRVIIRTHEREKASGQRWRTSGCADIFVTGFPLRGRRSSGAWPTQSAVCCTAVSLQA